MPYRLLADLTVALHAGFVLFVVAGGFLAWRWRRLAWIHLPCAIWGALIEVAGWICPLTPIEVSLRRRAGDAGYEGPLELAGIVVAVNAIAYVVFLRRGRSRRPERM